MKSSTLISEDYRKQQEMLHEKGNYGATSIAYAPLVTQIIDKLGVTHLLDYGCGAQTNLIKHIKPKHPITYQAYDPAVERFSSPPKPAEMVASIDVLEHIEPDYLDNVLDDLERLTEWVGIFSVCTSPAKKTLSDGRNAHLIQQPLAWWLPKFLDRFEIQTVQMVNDKQFYVIGYSLNNGVR